MSLSVNANSVTPLLARAGRAPVFFNVISKILMLLPFSSNIGKSACVIREAQKERAGNANLARKITFCFRC